MAIDKQKFIDDSIEIHKKRKRLQELASQRKAEEEALVVEFRINEANQRRSDIQKRYDDLARVIQQDIESISSKLGELD